MPQAWAIGAKRVPSSITELGIGAVGINTRWLTRPLGSVGHHSRIRAIGEHLSTNALLTALQPITLTSDKSIERILPTGMLKLRRQSSAIHWPSCFNQVQYFISYSLIGCIGLTERLLDRGGDPTRTNNPLAVLVQHLGLNIQRHASGTRIANFRSQFSPS